MNVGVDRTCPDSATPPVPKATVEVGEVTWGGGCGRGQGRHMLPYLYAVETTGDYPVEKRQPRERIERAAACTIASQQ